MLNLDSFLSYLFKPTTRKEDDLFLKVKLLASLYKLSEIHNGITSYDLTKFSQLNLNSKHAGTLLSKLAQIKGASTRRDNDTVYFDINRAQVRYLLTQARNRLNFLDDVLS